jgi:AraC family transcriptional regulator
MPDRSGISTTSPTLRHGRRQSARIRPDGPSEMARILDVPPVLAPEILRGDTRLTQRWVHGGLYNYMRGMTGHVVVGCHSGEEEISWRVERKRFASRTQRRAFTLIPEGYDGHWEIGGQVVVSHVYLTQEHLQACADEVAGGKAIELLVRVAFEDSAAAGLLEILSDEAARDSSSSRLFVEQAIDLLCLRLIRGHSSLDAIPTPVSRHGLADWQVRKVTAFIRDNLERQIGLDELAGLVRLSRFHFCTAFRRATGHSPHQWLTRQRIARARDLLVNSELSITEIALSVGYETPSAFTARFRNAMGITPSTFRRSM